MNKQDLRQELIDEFIKIEKQFNKESPGRKITRDYFRQHTKYQEKSWTHLFGSFKSFKQLASTQKEVTRESIRIKKNDRRKGTKRKYFVTSAISGAELDQDFFLSALNYCKLTNTRLVILPMRGVKVSDAGYAEELLENADYFATEYIFNSNLVAKDFLINPQMMNPLTGLDRFGQKHYSLIIASPKQFMRVVPVSHESYPHTIHSTGSITIPTYASTRVGRLAEQDHCRGGLIVEIENDKIFHIRQIQADKNGNFYDLGTYYTRKESEASRVSAIVLGDMHIGFECPTAVKAWMECIKKTNPKYIIMHDIFNAHSISHHHINNIERQVNRKKELNTLKKELNVVGETLKKWSETFPDKEIIVVRSNHDEALDRYLFECRYKDDWINHRLALRLAAWLINEKNPLEEYITTMFNIKNIRWLRRDKDYKLHNVIISAHGDKKAYGAATNNVLNAESSYGNAIIAHSHSPQVYRNVWRVGTTTELILDYNKGAPSNWLHASCLLYKSQQRQMITAIEGNWKI